VDEADSDGDGGGSAAVSLPAAATTRPVHSDKLMRRLTAQRVAAVQAELLARPDVAQAVLAAQLASQLLRERWHGDDEVLTVRASDTHDALPRQAEDIAESAAWKRLQAQKEHWRRRLPDEREPLLPWLLAQDAATVTELLTFLVASTVTGVSGVEQEDGSPLDGLAGALALDMRRWWSATAGAYLAHVAKSQLMAAVREAVSAEAAAPLAAMKKDAAVASAERLLAGTGWLPACLRTTPSTAPQPEPALMAEGRPAAS
jgi:ParB family chromosome partitioning protein